MAKKDITVTYSLSEENLNLALKLEELDSQVLTDFFGDTLSLLEEIQQSHPETFDKATKRADLSKRYNSAELREILQILMDKSLIEEKSPGNRKPYLSVTTEEDN